MNLMRFSGLAILAAGLVVLLVLCAACTSGSSGQGPVTPNTTGNTGSFAAVATASSQVERFTLEDAESAALQANQSFFYLRGEHVDSSGKAERWIFGIREGSTPSMIVYDSHGVSTLALPTNLTIQEDIPAGVLSPADALRIASNSPGAGSLDLNGGMATLQLMNEEYTIAGSGSSSEGVTINATTGELIATHG
ncbi:hypothetical protein [Methanoregula sp.]|uniref:hypothetical protein n=1 Tax=Methanoregula sp. TaxID=2052170 RepID=UPI002C0681B4|nr:hypothetical protein [Methanoregula sp.]HVP96462.1 hypothetical protein [Methanoregula sp.]